jgi:hypothetical protein
MGIEVEERRPEWVVKMACTLPAGMRVYAFASEELACQALPNFERGLEAQYMLGTVPQNCPVDAPWAAVIRNSEVPEGMSQ